MKRKFMNTVKQYGRAILVCSVLTLIMLGNGLHALAAPSQTGRGSAFTKEIASVVGSKIEQKAAGIEKYYYAKSRIETDRANKRIAEQKAEAILEKQEMANRVNLGQKIAEDALQYVGVLPYSWAGESLETGVDCSGFTMALYKQYGYQLSHDSNVQSTQGISVSLDEAQPGDIVVYPGHVGLYIGDGKIVHAGGSGETVSITDVDYMTPLDVRRIIY